MECKIVDACHYDADFILDLNQRFTPAVSDLSNDMMTYFLEISDYFKVLKVDGLSIGFLIALIPGKDYWSENYRWFNKNCCIRLCK